jgi:hypothetical protein
MATRHALRALAEQARQGSSRSGEQSDVADGRGSEHLDARAPFKKCSAPVEGSTQTGLIACKASYRFTYRGEMGEVTCWNVVGLFRHTNTTHGNSKLRPRLNPRSTWVWK